MKLKKILLSVAIVGFMILQISNIAFADSITCSGCPTEFYLMRALANKYKQKTGKKIFPLATGNLKAIKFLLKGQVRFAFTCQSLDKLAKKFKLQPEQVNKYSCLEIAKDPIAIVVNILAGIENLTLKQINKIFTGEVSNWTEVGGIDTPIKVGFFDPMLASGVTTVFKEKTIGVKTPFPKFSKRFQKPAQVIHFCSNTDGAVSILPMKSTLSGDFNVPTIDGIAPTEENVLSGKYPISATYYIIFDKNDTEIQEFADFIKSDEGKKIIDSKMIAVD